RKHLANGKLDKAWPKVSSAAAKVKWGFDFLNWWMDQLEKGSKRAEAGIKVSAALAALVVAAPLELGILGTMAVASVGEGAQQGTTLALKGADDAARTRFVDALAHFGIGFSWGGYESLVVPSDPQTIRTAVAWTDPDPLVRLSIGLEDPADLIADLERGFAAL
ncbi:MAG: PLP-dependent transferase, partial [Sphingopyxis sp.]|nr:PLP-dependent transferase [Sphingopyxis sp.]